MFRYTQETILQKFKETHDDKYDYSLVVFESSVKKVIIICKEHGQFEQTPSLHIRTAGCRRCVQRANASSLKNRDSVTLTEQFIEKAKKVHHDSYDYSLVNYIRQREKVIIICKEHGQFEQRPEYHLRGDRCRRCVSKIRWRKTNNNFGFHIR